MFSRLPILSADTSMVSIPPALYPPTSPTAHFGLGLPVQAEPPGPDYQGGEIFFVVSDMQAFERWRVSVEHTLVVDFVRGDKHSSRSTPKAFLEHVKLVCARHSRSGRRPYVKKHPERQRKVPSRKVPDGCPATISYRTFEDKQDVHVVYNPRHAHPTGPENYPFTREGRRVAARSKSNSRSPRLPPLHDFDDDEHRAHSEAPMYAHDGVAFTNSPAKSLSASSHRQHLPTVAPVFFSRADTSLISPVSGTPAVSPMRSNLGLPTSPVHTYVPPYHDTASANASPAHTTQSLPTPIYPAHPLPFSTPAHANSALSSSTPAYPIHALPSSTPAHHPHTLPNTPGYISHALPGPSISSPMHPNHGLASPVPIHTSHHLPSVSPVLPTHHLPSASPVHHSQRLPVSAHTTPLNISTQLPYESPDPFALLEDPMPHSDSSDQEYASISGIIQQDGNSLAVPGTDTISLTITSSPSPHPVALASDNLYAHLPPQQDAELNEDSGMYSTVMDLRAEQWARLKRHFDIVHARSNDVQYSEELLYRLDSALSQLVVEAQGRRSTAETLGFLLGPQS